MNYNTKQIASISAASVLVIALMTALNGSQINSTTTNNALLQAALPKAFAQSDSIQWYLIFQAPSGLSMKVPIGEAQPNSPIDKAVPIHSFSWGASNPTTIGSATGGAGAGKMEFKEFSIMKSVDKATPALFQNMATGAHYDKVTLLGAMKDGKGKTNIPIKIVLGTVFTTSMDISGGASSPTEEFVNFAYGKATLYFANTNADGTLTSYTQYGWNQMNNSEEKVPS